VTFSLMWVKISFAIACFSASKKRRDEGEQGLVAPQHCARGKEAKPEREEFRETMTEGSKMALKKLVEISAYSALPSSPARHFLWSGWAILSNLSSSTAKMSAQDSSEARTSEGLR